MGGRRCTVCDHKRRSEIDAAVAGGDSNRRIAARFRLPETVVRRHVTNHVSRHRAVAVAKREAKDLLSAAGFDLEVASAYERILAAEHEAADLVDSARRSKKPKDRNAALRTLAIVHAALSRDVELLGKLNGRLRPEVEITINLLARITDAQAVTIPAVQRLLEAIRTFLEPRAPELWEGLKRHLVGQEAEAVEVEGR